MNEVLQKIVDQLAKPEPEVVLQAMWATVTQASPLRIRFDGEAAALDITPVNLIGALVVGDRVRAQLVNKQLHVVARLNGVDLSGKANTIHTHTSAQITDLATTLAPYALDTDIVAAKGRMIKTTAGPTVSAAGTFYQVTSFSSIPYNTGTMMATTGIVTIPTAGVYHIEFFFPWSNYGSVFARQLAIAKGTTATNIVASKNVATNGVWQETVTYEDTCAAGNQFTFWVQSATTGSGAVASTALIPPTSVTVKEVI